MPFLTFLRRLLSALAAPARLDQGRGGVVIKTFRGYGDSESFSIMGRILHQPRFGRSVPLGTLRRDLIDLLRRLLRQGIAGAEVRVVAAGGRALATTDPEGYFRASARFPGERPSSGWLPVAITVEPGDEGPHQEAEGCVYIPPRSARQVVISDIDDTVMYTGVANKLTMLYRLYGQSADRRMPFPGVSALYQAFHEGRGGDEGNPMLYVSRAPWSIYEVLETFFQQHDIPIGPILYLREWGVSLRSPMPRRAESHKRDLIEAMLELYQDLPFVLIGDSGQHDPEVYADIVHAHGGRVKAVYIRNVSRRPERIEEIERLARELEKAGSPLLLAADSIAMAEHAVDLGLISEAALPAIRRRRDVESEPETDSAPQPTVSAGDEKEEIGESLETSGQGDSPPNVEIEETASRPDPARPQGN